MFLILHNPLSSNRKSRGKTKKYVRFFKRKNVPFIVRSSLKIEDLKQFLNDRPQITDILLLGGDGSINYLINSLDINEIKQNIHLAKSGSGNDFLRSLKKKKKANVTIGKADLDDDRHVEFINGCGLGFDGLVCHYVNNDRKKNKISYFINVFRSIIQFQAQPVTVIVDGKEFHYQKAYLVAIQNGRYFGGGMKASPKANIEDDDYHVIIVHTLPKLLLQILLLTIYPGWHPIFKSYITMLKGKTIDVKFEENNYFQADGEVHDHVKTIHVQAYKKQDFIAFEKKLINHKD
jgi:diacylglycerol kinase family enzyme